MNHDCTPDCTRGWSTGRKCHCRGCGENFSTASNFDRHLDRRGDKIACLPPAEAGLVVHYDRGVWAMPGEEDYVSRFAKAP